MTQARSFCPDEFSNLATLDEKDAPVVVNAAAVRGEAVKERHVLEVQCFTGLHVNDTAQKASRYERSPLALPADCQVAINDYILKVHTRSQLNSVHRGIIEGRLEVIRPGRRDDDCRIVQIIGAAAYYQAALIHPTVDSVFFKRLASGSAALGADDDHLR